MSFGSMKISVSASIMPVASGSAPVVVQSVQGSSASAWPQPTTAGNLLLFVINSTTPAGYTQVPNAGTSCSMWWEIAAGNDALPSHPGNIYAAIEISGNSTAAPINASGNLSATSTVPNCLAIAAAAQGGSVQSGWTPITTSNRWTADQTLAASGTTASGAWSASTGTNYQGVVIVAPK